MGKKLTIVAVAAALLGLVFITGPAAAAEVPDEVSLHDPAFGEHKKGPVKLHHKKHSEEYKLSCIECHHEYQNGKNVWKEGDPVKKCSACHDVEKREGKKDKLKNALHKNCKECHRKAGKGPFKKCNECHQE